MYPSAILFGSVGTITESSELQRQAFNAAFAEVGLDWRWDAGEYLSMLHMPGGAERIDAYAKAQGAQVDAQALHALKVKHFERMALQNGLTARPGVTRLIDQARGLGVKIGFVTTTGPQTLGLVLGGLARDICAGDFDVILDRSIVKRPKPDPEAYETALSYLDLKPNQVLAIEDTPESAQAALNAGIATVAFPGLAAQDRTFPGTVAQLDALTPDLLHTDLSGGTATYSAARSMSDSVAA
ncbi:MAG: HAD-IA family hydrolase [Paracoccaceae bacterium]|nr:HAD-IA family hydrolase [Paracoccaceae bacterium]